MAVKRAIVMDRAQVSNLIRDLRLLSGLTQEQFAAELSVTHSSVSRWERGISKPSPLAMQKVEGMLQQMGDRGKDLLVKHFPESEG
ncbi:DNA-binding transcriptional regulator [Chroococcidiopsis sp. CCNUC1]|uniref:helix-turn-helix domain-containing protein n=1 Tax=Chroococcidiopsis sp. CCNUC1 TaxID=2653189 RepID=UPI0020227A6D|nr:helix-turn-helix transcriptional regulator [Chroococcidiopsis sp. CCNUC1]URD48486.1 helix-turn-helix domain-containing protein [Chroococcidiopsis sp. CCNUC1]